MESGWGWVIVAGNVYIAAVFGAACRCYSVFYVPLMSEYSVDYATVAWLNGSFQMAYGIGSLCSSAFFKTIGIRNTVISASVLATLACLLSFWCPELWQIQMLVGTVCGFSCAPCMLGGYTILTRYFKTNLYTSMQLMCLGLSLGPFVACPLYQWLIELYGWRGCLLILAGIYFNMTISGGLMRPKQANQHLRAKGLDENKSQNDKVATARYPARHPNASQRRKSSIQAGAIFVADKLDLVVFKDLIFYIYICTWSTFSIAYNSTMIYLIPYAQKKLLYDDIRSASLISALSIGEVVSRVLIGFVLDKISRNYRLLVVAPLIAMIGVQVMCIPHTNSYILLTAICVTAGICGGGMDGAFSAFIAEMFDLKLYSSAFGYSNIIIHFIGMGSTLMLGWVVDSTGDFTNAFYFGGISAFLSTLATFAMNKLLTKKRNRR